MGIILSVYTKSAFKEYILPSINNADYSIVLYGEYFHLQKDLQFDLEVLGNQWYIKQGENNNFSLNINKSNQRKPLEKGDVIQVRTSEDEEISIIVNQVAATFGTYKKYQMQGIDKITIGKDISNNIVFNYQGMVSRHHAEIIKVGEKYKIVNLSINGLYVNSVRVEKEMELTFGSFINILGLHLVFLNDLIAIHSMDSTVAVSGLREYKESDKEVVLTDQNAKKSSGKIIYHRAPRYYERIEKDTIEIEEPPQLTQTKKQPLIMTVGPSLTMALPMILGCLMMVYASKSMGGNSMMMYSGLIMSVMSAFIGVIWTLVNLNYQKKEEAEQKELRFNSYSQYLIEKTEEIRKRYEATEETLKNNYPDARTCVKYNADHAMLWGRNQTHKDLLQHRIGIGDVPFQVEINIPKKRFVMIKDELAEKPAVIQKNFSTLYQVPITVDLLEKKLVGIIGGKRKSGAIAVAKLLAAQIAANNSYTDVKMGFIYNNASSSDYNQWKFSKWLPHVWSEDKKTRFVAASKEEASEVFYELTKVFRTRMEESNGFDKKKVPKPYYIIFISDASMLEGELFSKYIYEQKEEFGLTTILLSERYEDLPNKCEYVIENTESFQGMYDVAVSESKRQKIVMDTLDDESLDNFARYLSTLQVLETEDGGEIPNAITFFEMLGINKPDDLKVSELWAKSRTYENIRGMIGQKASGVPCYLDVHEKYHGPHGLVAGTTGSGKSETLQTYMLSLAVNYSPNDIGFFIIDYKGGGMANLFEGLPHMIGQISNLSGNQVKRAMISIKSENRRRQRVFTEHGVNNINLYTKLYKNGEAAMPIPHLFIIIDEFAELKREEPEFMKELISVAQVGRSLGVHLILATQKPSGTVDDSIWSNSKFRLCLRVQDQQDSKDMLHKPDAAYITQAGRCYLQVGNDEVYELFQSGFSGAVYDENTESGSADIAKLINLTGKVDMTGNSVKLSQKKKAENRWIEKLIECLQSAQARTDMTLMQAVNSDGKMQNLITELYGIFSEKEIEYSESRYNTDRLMEFIRLYCSIEQVYTGEKRISEVILDTAAAQSVKLPQPKEKTQLDAVKEYLAKVARENGYHHKFQLWMPVLKDHIYLDEFEQFRKNKYENGAWKEQDNVEKIKFVIGKMDDPENQNQMPLSIDLIQDGHIAIFGNIVSGKSTMMQTIAYALMNSYTPERVNMYALDFSSKMMSAFEEAPHFGGVMYENDADKIGKFFNMISMMLEERKELFRGGNFKQYLQVHGAVLPAIVIFVDNYSAFKEKTAEKYEDDMIRLSKEGVSHGIYLIISGTGIGMNDVTSRVAENINTVLCLALADKYAYGDLLHSMQIEVMPEASVKGRGLAYYGERILEYQTALALEAENDYQRLERIKEECMEMRNCWIGKMAKPIPEIPKEPVWSRFVELPEYLELAHSKEYVPVGYDQSNAEIYNISLRNIYCYLICGTQRSGKTNFMRVFAQSVLDKGAKVCMIDGPGNLMRAYKKYDDVSYANDEDSIYDFLLTELTPVFKERNILKNELLNEDYEEDEIFERMKEERPYFIFISEFSWFVPYIYNAEKDMRAFLETLFAKGRLHNIYFIADVTVNKASELVGYQLYELFVGYKTGIHFGGKVVDNMILSFDYMSYSEQGKADKAGIGTLPNVMDEKETQKVVIPLAKK